MGKITVEVVKEDDGRQRASVPGWPEITVTAIDGERVRELAVRVAQSLGPRGQRGGGLVAADGDALAAYLESVVEALTVAGFDFEANVLEKPSGAFLGLVAMHEDKEGVLKVATLDSALRAFDALVQLARQQIIAKAARTAVR